MENELESTYTVPEYKTLFDLDLMMRESKSPIVRAVPKFIRTWLKKTVQQDEINRIHKSCYAYTGTKFASKALDELGVTLKVENIENIAKNKRYVFVANHPFGAVDGMAMIKLIGENFGSINFIGNQMFHYIPNLVPIVTPVDVFGRNSREAIRALNDVYASDLQILNFPSGEVSRRYNKIVEDCKWQKSFLQKAIEHDRVVVPVFICGENSSRFYKWYKRRRFFRIGMNFELMLLPDEMLRKSNSTVRIIFGKPIVPAELPQQLNLDEKVQLIRNYVYNLEKTVEQKC
jgi:putative hemolysin